MATPISGLSGTFVTYATTNLMVVVDVTDTSMASTGTDKKISVSSFLSNYSIVTNPGSTSITTLGTVTTGTWNGDVIAPSYLAPMVGSGLSHSAGIVPDPGATPGTGKFLREDATWQTISLSDVSSSNVTATGSTTARSLATRFAEVFNVKDYGAVGDGSTDDTTAIQNTLNAAGVAGGGKVWFPAGTYIILPPTGQGITLSYSNIEMCGISGASIIKIKNNAGNYNSMFIQGGTWSSGPNISNIYIHDLWFDNNPSGNTTCDILVSGYVFNALRFYNVTNLTVVNCTFDPCCGVNTIMVTKGSSGTPENIQIIENKFNFVRGVSTNTDYDNSAVYLDAITQRVISNRWYAAISQHARGCVESHNGQSVIEGNTADGYQTLCNIVQEQGGATRNNNDIHVVGNTVSNCNYGIQIWPYFSPSVLRNIRVADNLISVDQVTHNENDCWAIGIPWSSDINAPSENIAITDNIIEMNPADTRTVDRFSVALRQASVSGIFIGNNNTVDGLIITGNTIRNAPGNAISLGQPTFTIKNAIVKNNQIIDAGKNSNLTGTYRAAFRIFGVLTNVQIENNQIFDTGAVALNGSYEVDYSPDAGATVVSYRNNLVQTASGLTLTRLIGSPAPDTQDIVSYGTQDRTTNYQKISTSWNGAAFQMIPGYGGSAIQPVFVFTTGTVGAITNTLVMVNGGDLTFGDEANFSRHFLLRRNGNTIGYICPNNSQFTMMGGSLVTGRSMDLVIHATGRVGVGIFNPSYGLHQTGGGYRLQQLATPGAPTVTPTGTPGSTTYNYYIVAKDNAGNLTLPGPVGSTSTGNATLNATNYNALSWSSVTGAVTYDVLRGDTAHSVATGVTVTTYQDKGTGLSAYTTPTRNATGDMIVDGNVVVGASDVFLTDPGYQVTARTTTASKTVLGIAGATSQTAPLVVFSQVDSVGPAGCALIDAVWTNSTHATRQGRLDLYAADYNANRLGVSVGSNGSATLLGFYGATPVIQSVTTGTTTGFTAGSGTAANSDSTYTGNTGSTAYTVGDIVYALKKLGLIAT